MKFCLYVLICYWDLKIISLNVSYSDVLGAAKGVNVVFYARHGPFFAYQVSIND